MDIMPRALDVRDYGLAYENDTYAVPPYVASREIVDMHQWPRWGWSSQFTSALSGQDQRSEYLKGIIIGSLITLMVFVLWAIVLVALKLAGKRVGCASGVPRKPQKPEKFVSNVNSMEDDENGKEEMQSEQEYEQSLAIWKADVRKFERRLLVSRVIFLFSGCIVIAASVLFYVKGVGSLVNSLQDIQFSIDHTGDILKNLHNTTETFIQLGEEAQADRDSMINSTSEFCGIDLVANVTSVADQELQKGFESVINALTTVGDFVQDTAKKLERDLSAAITLAKDANNGLNQAYPYLYCTAAAMGVLIIIAIALMVDVILAWRGRKVKNCFFRCMNNAVVLPIFFFFILVSWLFASLFQLTAIAGSDFCITPDDNVDFIVEKYMSEDFSLVLLAYVTYYIRCTPKPISLDNGVSVVAEALGSVHDFFVYISETPEAAAQVCGAEGVKAIQNIAGALHETMHLLYGLLLLVMELLKCSTFNPIYVNVLHSGLCINGVGGLAWLFSSLLIIAIFSMVMLTFRAARAEVEGDMDEELPAYDGGYEPYDPNKANDEAYEAPQNEESYDLSEEEEEPKGQYHQQPEPEYPQEPQPFSAMDSDRYNPFDLSQPGPDNDPGKVRAW